VRSARRADDVRGDVARRGAAADAAISVHTFGERGGGAERIISYDVPFSADELRTVHETGGTVLVTPAELAHFMRIAAEVPFTLKQRRARVLEQDEVEAFRARIRSAVAGEDLAAQLLVLDPLLEEYSPAEVAAALSALLRQKEEAQSAAGGGASPTRATAAPTGSAPTGAPPQDGGAFTRLFVSIGSRDNVRPGDLVGAITGEANIRGEQVGRVDIRDTFSVVEVAAGVADRVIRALNGTTMRGRSLRVDFDRKSGGGDGGRGGPRQGPGRAGPRGAGAGGSGPPRRRPPQR
jgi:ATP-dependent RNA helicase DeaD